MPAQRIRFTHSSRHAAPEDWARLKDMLATIDTLRAATLRHLEAGELDAANDKAGQLAAASRQAQALLLHIRRIA
jgi:hypothetical protein